MKHGHRASCPANLLPFFFLLKVLALVLGVDKFSDPNIGVLSGVKSVIVASLEVNTASTTLCPLQERRLTEIQKLCARNTDDPTASRTTLRLTFAHLT